MKKQSSRTSAASVRIMMSLYNVALIFGPPFQNWRLKWRPGSGVRCWKTWWVKRFIWIRDDSWQWYPGDLAPCLTSLMICLCAHRYFTSLRFHSLVTKGGVGSDEGWCSFKLKLYEWVLWIFFPVKLLIHGEFYIKQTMAYDQKSKLTLKTTCWKQI